jgi:hypothetical protein
MKIECTNCDNKKPLKGKKIRKIYDPLISFLTVEAYEYRCPKCGEIYYFYGDIVKLHKIIVNLLIQKEGFLSGNEIRFLRKHLGYSSEMFANILGMDLSTIYRIESKQEHSKTVDNFIRILVAASLPDRDYSFHDQILRRKKMEGNILISEKGEISNLSRTA